MNSLNWLLLFGLLSLFINALYAQSETSEDTSEDSSEDSTGDVTTTAADSGSDDCEYILTFKSGSCIRNGETGSGSNMYTCATSSTFTLMAYTSDDCSGTATSTTTVDSSSGFPFSCGSGTACDSFSATVFTNSTTCTDPLTFDYVSTCVSFGLFSTMTVCDGGSISTNTYTTTDCSGDATAASVSDDCTYSCSAANTISVVMGFCVMLMGLIWSLH